MSICSCFYVFNSLFILFWWTSFFLCVVLFGLGLAPVKNQSLSNNHEIKMPVQVINGLMQRVDWTSAIKKPVGCLPGGSGNALSCSINYAAGYGHLPVLDSTIRACWGVLTLPCLCVTLEIMLSFI